MYLKRLEIFGFKTFAEKTEILFTPGVTAVIGPNGSGKSNVGDAILWVLGEQNIRTLRGSSSQDVIFAGNERRKPLGMAEVSLTIDNSTRILPLDFSEVTITRRVYRSGEGEFFINRVACRLRDIYELFLDTGIGRDAYSFVNQSEIDAILSVRAEDRRQIFEEAAGIKKYRVRKREALKKLENTRANLARVNDIIGEIEAQLEPLRRQAQVARRHQELYARLRELELTWYAATLRRLAAESERLGRLIEDLNAGRAALEGQLEAVRGEEADRRSRLHALDVELERLRLEEAEQARQVSQAESQVALLAEREENARRQAEALAAEIQELTTRGEDLRARGEAAASEQAALAAAIAERQAARGSVQERAAGLARELEAAGRALEARRAHRVELARRHASARHQVEHLESRQRSLAATRERLRSEREEWTNQEAQTRSRLEEARTALQELEAAVARTQDTLKTLAAEAQAAASALKAATAERDRIAAALTRTRARRQALSELAESFEGYEGGAKAVLTASRKGDLPAGFRPLLEALRVPPGLEAALEAALGSAAQAVIVPSTEAARHAVAYLRERALGRATLLPLDGGCKPTANRTGEGESRAANGADPARPALLMDRLEIDEDALPAARALLDGIELVHDLESALARFAAAEDVVPGGHNPSPPLPYSCVTLEGDRVSATGVVTGGRERREVGRSQSLLARRREMDELEAAAAALDRELAAATAQVERLQREGAELAARRSTLQAENDQRGYRREELRREQQRSGADAERLARAAVRLAEAEADNTREQAEAAAALDTARAAAEASAFDDSALEEEIERARADLDQRQAGLRALEREAADARVEVAGLEEKARSGAANVRRLQESAGSVERQARARRDQAAALAAERESLARQRREWQEEAGRRAGSLAALQEQAEARRGERAAHADQLEAAAAHLRELSDRAGELLQRAHRAEVERTAAETERSHLAAQLVSDYEMTPEELTSDRRSVLDVWRSGSGDPSDLSDPTDPSDLTAQHPTPNTERRSLNADPGEIARLRRQLKGLGPVNPEAIEEYERLSERYTFLSGQRDDLEAAQEQIGEAIREIDATTRETFMRAFKEIGAAFDRMFQRLFGGGRTELLLTDPGDVLETGIEIIVQPPGKKLQNLLLLSGGERALTASAMLFALLTVRPSPFCVLDEVDAPLDEANVGRFGEVLREFAERSQFVVVTHNRGTMEAAHTLYGVTMEEPGISKLVSVRLDDVAAEAAEAAEERLHFLATR